MECLRNIRSKTTFFQLAEILHQSFQIIHHQPNLSVWLALVHYHAKGCKQGVILKWHGRRGQGQRLQSPHKIIEALFCEGLALGSNSWSNRFCCSRSWGNMHCASKLGQKKPLSYTVDLRLGTLASVLVENLFWGHLKGA